MISAAARAMANPRVFFDMTADGAALGRIVMEVRSERPTGSSHAH
jgi:hypothetical protein